MDKPANPARAPRAARRPGRGKRHPQKTRNGQDRSLRDGAKFRAFPRADDIRPYGATKRRVQGRGTVKTVPYGCKGPSNHPTIYPTIYLSIHFTDPQP